MKTLYNNPFASQLLAASSKMFSSFDVNPFLQTTFKQVVVGDDKMEMVKTLMENVGENGTGQDGKNGDGDVWKW